MTLTAAHRTAATALLALGWLIVPANAGTASSEPLPTPHEGCVTVEDVFASVEAAQAAWPMPIITSMSVRGDDLMVTFVSPFMANSLNYLFRDGCSIRSWEEPFDH